MNKPLKLKIQMMIDLAIKHKFYLSGVIFNLENFQCFSLDKFPLS